MRVLVDECLPRQVLQWLSTTLSVLVFPTNRAKLVRAGVRARVQPLPRSAIEVKSNTRRQCASVELRKYF